MILVYFNGLLQFQNWVKHRVSFHWKMVQAEASFQVTLNQLLDRNCIKNSRRSFRDTFSEKLIFFEKLKLERNSHKQLTLKINSSVQIFSVCKVMKNVLYQNQLSVPTAPISRALHLLKFILYICMRIGTNYLCEEVYEINRQQSLALEIYKETVYV